MSTPLRRQLPLFLGAARSSVSYSFALTDDTGSRLFVYVHKEGDISFCAVSVQQQQTPLFSLLASVIQLAALGESSNLLSTAIQLLCRHLAPPSVGTALRVAFTPAGVCNLACQVGANAPASQLPAADELLYDVIGCLGLSQALEAWAALLLERPVLLLSSLLAAPARLLPSKPLNPI